MNLYLLSINQTQYDQYTEAVVVAKNEERARMIHPNGDYAWLAGSWRNSKGQRETDKTWANPSDVSIQLLGKADRSIKDEKVICASFRAG